MNYSELLKKLTNLDKDYLVRVIGKTKFNRKIIAVERIVDESFSTAIFLSSIHARENITTDLLLEMVENKLFDKIDKFNLSFIVMANPDGVELQSGGLDRFPKRWQKKLVSMNGGSKDFSMWKANAKGVDLNNNFDARWGTNKHSLVPSSQGFVGTKVFSEKESKAISKYTKKMNPFITISYHTKGEEIYFNFFQDEKRLVRDELIAKRFASSTGYIIRNVEKSSSGGYKDWCVQKLKIPALTLELGSDELSHPISNENLSSIFEKNKSIAFDLEYAYNVFEKSRWKIWVIKKSLWKKLWT